MTALARAWAALRAGRYWLAAIAIIAALSYLKGCDDGQDRIRAQHARDAAKTERRARQAGDTASTAKEQRDRDFTRQQEELRHATATKSGDGVGRNTRTVLERVRDQQAAADQAAR